MVERVEKQPEILSERGEGYEWFKFSMDGKVYAVAGVKFSGDEAELYFKRTGFLSRSALREMRGPDAQFIKNYCREREAKRIMSITSCDDREFVRFTQWFGYQEHFQVGFFYLEENQNV